jgi:hypothetical protein
MIRNRAHVALGDRRAPLPRWLTGWLHSFRPARQSTVARGVRGLAGELAAALTGRQREREGLTLLESEGARLELLLCGTRPRPLAN